MTYQQLPSTFGELHRAPQQAAGKAVNQLHMPRNWTVGCLIVEFEQHGEERASYGERMLKNLCADLASQGMTGLGLSTLKGCRTVYRLHPQSGQSAIGQLEAVIACHFAALKAADRHTPGNFSPPSANTASPKPKPPDPAP
jgi:hypothetical protein